MTNYQAIAATGLLLFGLSGCTPPFYPLQSNASDGPTVAAVVVHIECSVQRALIKNPALAVWAKNYVAAGNLTVEVTQSEGLNPSFNFINPYKVTPTNITLAVGAQLDGTQHRTFNYQFPIVLAQMDTSAKSSLPKRCADPDTGTAATPTVGASESNYANQPEAIDHGITGDLGLDDILQMGRAVVGSTLYGDAKTVLPPGIGISGQIFGSTIDFTVVQGINGGPNWTLNHFKGPTAGGSGGGAMGSAGAGGASAGGGGSQGLLNFNRTAKDTLVLSFAAASQTAGAHIESFGLAGPDAAYSAAQGNNTQMLLQNLLSP